MQLQPRERVAIIGSGGKTTLMIRLAQSCAGRIIMSTTTHLATPRQSGQPYDDRTCLYPGTFVPFLNVQDFCQRWPHAGDIVLTARSDALHNRLIGLSPHEIDTVSTLADLDLLLVEADGSKRLPLKAHNSTEPVLFASCSLGIAVIGMRALHRRVCAGQVHRPELLQQVLNCREGHVITTQDLARSALSYLQQFACARRALVFSQCEHSADADIKATEYYLRELLAQQHEPWAQNVEISRQTLAGY